MNNDVHLNFGYTNLSLSPKRVPKPLKTYSDPFDESLSVMSSRPESVPISEPEKVAITGFQGWTRSTNPSTAATKMAFSSSPTNTKGWDLDKTIEHLNSHAHEKSTHYCARYVRQALEAGNLFGFRVANAKDEINDKTLEKIGFKKIAEADGNNTTEGYTPQKGDVYITYENGNHAAMYNGNQWISDFRQKGINVYGNNPGVKSIIYRRSAKHGGLLTYINGTKTN